MKQLRYSVAASLDGFIAGPNGEFDWILVDPEIDFAALYASFSGLVMGRRSYDVYARPWRRRAGAADVRLLAQPARRLSRWRNLRARCRFARPAAEGSRRQAALVVGRRRSFRELAQAGLVDGVDVAVIPIVLGPACR